MKSPKKNDPIKALQWKLCETIKGKDRAHSVFAKQFARDANFIQKYSRHIEQISFAPAPF
jgi:hypothetical protein